MLVLEKGEDLSGKMANSLKVYLELRPAAKLKITYCYMLVRVPMFFSLLVNRRKTGEKYE